MVLCPQLVSFLILLNQSQHVFVYLTDTLMCSVVRSKHNGKCVFLFTSKEPGLPMVMFHPCSCQLHLLWILVYNLPAGLLKLPLSELSLCRVECSFLLLAYLELWVQATFSRCTLLLLTLFWSPQYYLCADHLAFSPQFTCLSIGSFQLRFQVWSSEDFAPANSSSLLPVSWAVTTLAPLHWAQCLPPGNHKLFFWEIPCKQGLSRLFYVSCTKAPQYSKGVRGDRVFLEKPHLGATVHTHSLSSRRSEAGESEPAQSWPCAGPPSQNQNILKIDPMILALPLPKDMEKTTVETGEKYLVEKAMIRPVREKKIIGYRKVAFESNEKRKRSELRNGNVRRGWKHSTSRLRYGTLSCASLPLYFPGTHPVDLCNEKGVLAGVTERIEVPWLCLVTAKWCTSLARLYLDGPQTGIETSITAAPTLGNQWWGKGWGMVYGWGDHEAGTEAKGMGTQSSRLQVSNEWNPLARKPASCSACHAPCWHVSAACIPRHQVPGNKSKYENNLCGFHLHWVQ